MTNKIDSFKALVYAVQYEAIPLDLFHHIVSVAAIAEVEAHKQFPEDIDKVMSIRDAIVADTYLKLTTTKTKGDDDAGS